ncbi:MAG: HAMP domain-containing histidine kinase, partial [Pandoraea sp.]|nr:HAMP domain-containing histidine kinase [Pandoraea sp.]
ADMSATARERLVEFRQGIERGRHMLEHLLTLSSVQATQSDGHAATDSVLRVFRQTLETLYPLAEAKGIDLGIEASEDASLPMSEADLSMLIKNLVDNAIRYTPAGGRVDMMLSSGKGQTVLCVKDTGPGIAPKERDRVFDAFYRGLGTSEVGSGLGLSIVKAIAEKAGADVRLAYADEVARTGLSVTVVVPGASTNVHEGGGA